MVVVVHSEYLWTFEVEAWYGTQLKHQLMETVHGRMEHNIANQASGLGKYIYISIVISYYYMDSEMELTTIRRSCYLYSTTLQCFYIDDFTSAGVAGSSSGAHLHTFSSPAPSPVKRRPPAASSMVLTSFLEKSLPISSNDGRSNRRMQLLLWREQNRTGVFPTRCMPKSVRTPCNRSACLATGEQLKTVERSKVQKQSILIQRKLNLQTGH
jgi:hypothetical protein